MSSLFDLSGSRILVTGAAAGIGAATALLCARLGAEVLLVDRNEAAGTLDAVRRNGGRGDALKVDLADRGAPDRVAAFAGALDATVLAAGRYEPTDWEESDWDAGLEATLQTNLVAPIRLARALVPGMATRGRGRLVLVGSIVATTGGSLPGVGPQYAVSKGGLHTFVRWLAARFTPHGVLANGVAPGLTETGMIAGEPGLVDALARHPMRRAATPDEIAGPIAFLCSPAASFISGAVLDVNGGALMRP